MKRKTLINGIDIIGDSQSVMGHNEADLHNGYVWRGSDRVSVNAGESVSYMIEPCGIADPDTELNSWFVWSVFSAGPVLVEVFKSPEYSAGTTLPLHNGIICLDNSPLLAIKKGATKTADGTIIDTLEMGSSKDPSPVPEQEEWQCRTLKVHVKITNNDNSAQYITTRFRVAEHA